MGANGYTGDRTSNRCVVPHNKNNLTMNLVESGSASGTAHLPAYLTFGSETITLESLPPSPTVLAALGIERDSATADSSKPQIALTESPEPTTLPEAEGATFSINTYNTGSAARQAVEEQVAGQFSFFKANPVAASVSASLNIDEATDINTRYMIVEVAYVGRQESIEDPVLSYKQSPAVRSAFCEELNRKFPEAVERAKNDAFKLCTAYEALGGAAQGQEPKDSSMASAAEDEYWSAFDNACGNMYAQTVVRGAKLKIAVKYEFTKSVRNSKSTAAAGVNTDSGPEAGQINTPDGDCSRFEGGGSSGSAGEAISGGKPGSVSPKNEQVPGAVAAARSALKSLMSCATVKKITAWSSVSKILPQVLTEDAVESAVSNWVSTVQTMADSDDPKQQLGVGWALLVPYSNVTGLLLPASDGADAKDSEQLRFVAKPRNLFEDPGHLARWDVLDKYRRFWVNLNTKRGELETAIRSYQEALKTPDPTTVPLTASERKEFEQRIGKYKGSLAAVEEARSHLLRVVQGCVEYKDLNDKESFCETVDAKAAKDQAQKFADIEPLGSRPAAKKAQIPDIKTFEIYREGWTYNYAVPVLNSTCEGVARDGNGGNAMHVASASEMMELLKYPDNYLTRARWKDKPLQYWLDTDSVWLQTDPSDKVGGNQVYGSFNVADALAAINAAKIKATKDGASDRQLEQALDAIDADRFVTRYESIVKGGGTQVWDSTKATMTLGIAGSWLPWKKFYCVAIEPKNSAVRKRH